MNQKNAIRISFFITLLIPFGVISQLILCYHILKFNKIVTTKLLNDKTIKEEDATFVEY